MEKCLHVAVPSPIFVDKSPATSSLFIEVPSRIVDRTLYKLFGQLQLGEVDFSLIVTDEFSYPADDGFLSLISLHRFNKLVQFTRDSHGGFPGYL